MLFFAYSFNKKIPIIQEINSEIAIKNMFAAIYSLNGDYGVKACVSFYARVDLIRIGPCNSGKPRMDCYSYCASSMHPK